MNIADFISDPALLGPFFSGSSWDRWKAVLRGTYALTLAKAERALFAEVAGDRDPPRHPVRELVACVGRGGGKDAISTGIAAHAAVNLDPCCLRPGERGTVMIIANSKDQAAIAARYTAAYFEQCALLAPLVESSRDGKVVLRNGAEIVTVANSLRAPRGRRVICAIFDEVATWRSDESATPDHEVDTAVAPGLARHPGAMKILISSPYMRRGLLYEKWLAAFGKDDPDTLVVHGTSLQFNPTLDSLIIERELEKDRARAGAEYLAEWRDDLSSFVDAGLVDELIDHGTAERPHDALVHSYHAFADESSGQGKDASTLGICHRDAHGRVIQDLLRVFRPPFSPSAVIEQKAKLLRQFRLARVTGDGWATGLVADLYRANGIRYEQTARPKSVIYLDFLGLLSSRQVLMLDQPQQRLELLGLERRTAWGGRDTINHPTLNGAHDDAVNALAGAAVLCTTAPRLMKISNAFLARAKTPGRFAGPRYGHGYI